MKQITSEKFPLMKKKAFSMEGDGITKSLILLENNVKC